MKTEMEQAMTRLQEERAALKLKKAEEQDEWEREREKEVQRLRRECRILEKQTRACLQLPTRKERSEVEALETLLKEERQRSQAKDARQKLTVDRLRRQIAELQEQNSDLRDEVRYLEERLLELRQAGSRKSACHSRGTSTDSYLLAQMTDTAHGASKECIPCASQPFCSPLAAGTEGQEVRGFQDLKGPRDQGPGIGPCPDPGPAGASGSPASKSNRSSRPPGGNLTWELHPNQAVVSSRSDEVMAVPAAHTHSPATWQAQGARETGHAHQAVRTLPGGPSQFAISGDCSLPAPGAMQGADKPWGGPHATLYRGGRGGGSGGPGPCSATAVVGNGTSISRNGQDGRALTLAEIAEASFNCHDGEPLLPDQALQHGCSGVQPQLPTQATSRGAQPSLARGDARWQGAGMQPLQLDAGTGETGEDFRSHQLQAGGRTDVHRTAFGAYAHAPASAAGQEKPNLKMAQAVPAEGLDLATRHTSSGTPSNDWSSWSSYSANGAVHQGSAPAFAPASKDPFSTAQHGPRNGVLREMDRNPHHQPPTETAQPLFSSRFSGDQGDRCLGNRTFLNGAGPEPVPMYDSLMKETRYPDGKLEKIWSSGRVSVVFSNGTAKDMWPDGLCVIHFKNGDVKKTFADGKVEYYYAEVDTWHTTFPDGLEVFHFANGQTEAHYPVGHKEIAFPDGSMRIVFCRWN
eukprot:jgi/Botrbrau1/21269/Bobra.39_2s0059.1